jgi:hypothetical protein
MKYKNNPLNIRGKKTNTWVGQSGVRKGFCEFSSLEYGVRAAAYLIMMSYRRAHCTTVRNIIYRWAPPADHNNTESYINFVCSKANLQRSTIIDTIDEVALLVWAMGIFEQGKDEIGSSSFVSDVITKFKLKFRPM